MREALSPRSLSPAGVAGQLSWISSASQIKFCDGTTWQATNATTGTSCSGVTTGTIQWSGSHLQYCNGTNWIIMESGSLSACSGTTAGTFTWDSSATTFKVCDGTNWFNLKADPCMAASPTPGTVCSGGAIYLGSLNPGATSGSGTDKYMTTPGGCGEIPSGQIVGTGASAYPNADFTPTCSGTDSLTKNWNDGTSNYYDIPGLTNYTTTTGTGSTASNKDLNYGSTNTTNIVAITAAANGGYHAGARYCDRLNYGGYTDWYLPNRYELNLMWTNRATIPGLDISGNYYWSSTEYGSSKAWYQRFSDGNQNFPGKNGSNRIRCVRRY